MKLEPGKRYVRRDGEVTGPLVRYESRKYPFYDHAECEVYRPNGRYWDHGEEPEDLISEYIEGDKASQTMRNADRPASEMTKREAIAAGVLAQVAYLDEMNHQAASLAIDYADALLAELEKGGGE